MAETMKEQAETLLKIYKRQFDNLGKKIDGRTRGAISNDYWFTKGRIDALEMLLSVNEESNKGTER